jgi:hypothetical protein
MAPRDLNNTETMYLRGNVLAMWTNTKITYYMLVLQNQCIRRIFHVYNTSKNSFRKRCNVDEFHSAALLLTTPYISFLSVDDKSNAVFIFLLQKKVRKRYQSQSLTQLLIFNVKWSSTYRRLINSISPIQVNIPIKYMWYSYHHIYCPRIFLRSWKL